MLVERKVVGSSDVGPNGPSLWESSLPLDAGSEKERSMCNNSADLMSSESRSALDD